ncbi:MAG TPA: NrfD/PsrC family molybdoenzyme membrane anchor subunit [Roseiflexaceae bacterium]|nr:NrfD/PsrC family molybdoenzyme membrane anchor subunit [Roseiflexaceae bacterium]
MASESLERYEGAPVIEPGYTYGSVTDTISSIVLHQKTPRGWWIGFAIAFLLTLVLLGSISYLLLLGPGIWGLNIPVAWAFDITNFVWWVGIGHAGTLISAILLLFRQQWRTSINRFAEAMTLFAVANAGLFPLLHTGRPWLDYWLIPYPNNQGLWPNFRSPLVWDVFAITTYATTSLLFWYVGLIPDLATLRDSAQNRFVKYVYGFFSMGWRGSARHWLRYERAYLLLAALATPLVVSVHSVVSLDFAAGILPGWHATIFPPYFVAGAIYSGFAMVATLAIPLRKFYKLEDFITMRHLDNMGKIMVATGLIVVYSYFVEGFISWYSGNPNEQFVLINRLTGPYAPLYFMLLACNGLPPFLLWSRRIRLNVWILFVLSLVINVGMWLERFIIIVTSLHRSFIPAEWDMFYPTIWDWSTYVGTLGLFFALLFLFVRFLPAISIFEMRELVSQTKGDGSDGTGGAHGDGTPHPAPAEATR